MKVFNLSICVLTMLVLVMSSNIVRAGLAPDFVLTDVDGNVFGLSDFRGRVVVLDFFATYCSVCRQEIGELRVVKSQFGSGVVIVSISVWAKDTDEVLKRFRTNYSISWILARDTANVYKSYGSPNIPGLVTVDQDGNIRHTHIGLTDSSLLIEEINTLMPATITLTVSVSPSLSNVHFKVDGVTHYTSGGSFNVELNPGTHQVQLVDTVVREGEDTEYRFGGWNGISSGLGNPIQIEISASSTLTADFQSYFKVVFTQSEIDGTPCVTVDGASYTLPQTLWLEGGSSHSFSYEPVSAGVGIQYAQASTSYPSPITVESPTTVVASYKIQYYLIVNTDPANVAPQPTVSPSGSWHDAGVLATCIAQAVNRCRFNYWVLDGTPQEAEDAQLTITMFKPREATAHYSAVSDLNFDGKVDETDMLEIVAAFQSKLGDITYDPNMDFDNNGLIGIVDVSVVARDFGNA